ncbi:hypothetical protein OG897_26305 [Streptomyces sp. NBC_00237]|uniref:hypothetical protein n=1 Tax=Streptomyces sp. NBC_00237 TaxID=2975687 RepID=UPI0022598D76|nr:hypothetical protein [Streptomyces sp. NBC_00237]MCX5204955.1 hypothetical protein [Streptomyces sp. NBC_00237]
MAHITDCDLGLHDGWVVLPLDPDADVSGWADATARELAERASAEGSSFRLDLLRQELREQAADSRERSPVLAAALYLNGFESAAVVLEADFVLPSEEVPVITSDWFVRNFSDAALGTPDVSHGEVPAGPCTRIKQLLAGPRADQDGARPLLETIAYAVFPENTRSAVLVLFSWTGAGVEESVQRMATDIVASLTVELSA